MNTQSALSIAAKMILGAPKPLSGHNLPLDLPEDADEELILKARESGFIPRLNLEDKTDED